MTKVWNVETGEWEEITLPEWDDLEYPYAFCPPPPELTEADWEAAFMAEDSVFVEDEILAGLQ